MPDGCRLATDVYLPAPGRHPVLLAMTPYGRVNKRTLAAWLVDAGYAVVIQDVRGRYDSEGEFDPIHQEKSDGPVTVDWITGQDWYDRSAGIGILGISYLATVGLAAAAQRPAAVKAMVNIGGLKGFYDVSHRGGALVLHHSLPWTIITGYSPQPSLKHIDWPQVYRTLPLEAAAEAAGFPVPLWRDWAGHRCKDEFWARRGVEEFLPEVDIPILHLSGWYDMCLGATLELYDYFRYRARAPQSLVVGPWTHNTVLVGPDSLHEVDFGTEARGGVVTRIARFLDQWLRPDGGRPGPDPYARFFLTGENRWLESQTWPATRPLELYLDGGGLSRQRPARAGKRCFHSDPDHPVPTLGGTVWEFALAGLEPGPADQSSLVGRSDLLWFESGPLEHPLRILGRVKVELEAATDGDTTDFTAKLMDLGPDGTARWTADGVVRAHFRHGPERMVPVVPGRAEVYEIDLWACGHTFAPGHRVALEIASSSFPKYDRNPNCLAGHERVATQTVYYGGPRPSRLCLPVLEVSG